MKLFYTFVRNREQHEIMFLELREFEPKESKFGFVCGFFIANTEGNNRQAGL